MMEFEDAMIDVVWKKLDIENNRFKDIDTKAIGVITIIGILMTFLAKPTDSGFITSTLFISTALIFLEAILLSVSVIRVRKGEGVSTKILISGLKKEKPENQIRGIISTIADAEDKLGDVCDNKAYELSLAVYTLGAGIISLIFYSLFTFIIFF